MRWKKIAFIFDSDKMLFLIRRGQRVRCFIEAREVDWVVYTTVNSIQRLFVQIGGDFYKSDKMP